MQSNRRDFIKSAGSLAGGATIAAIPSIAPAAEPVKLELLDPTGAQEITHLFAARLPDLNGKVIAELAVDATKWQPHRTMPYIADLLTDSFNDGS
jgi:hypothetical protein